MTFGSSSHEESESGHVILSVTYDLGGAQTPLVKKLLQGRADSGRRSSGFLSRQIIASASWREAQLFPIIKTVSQGGGPVLGAWAARVRVIDRGAGGSGVQAAVFPE